MSAAPAWSLRASREEDVELLWRIQRDALGPYVTAAFGTDAEEQRRFFDEHFDWRRHQIVQIDGRDAGYLMVDVRPDHVYLANVALLPEFQRRGVGTQLVRRVLARADGLGLPVRLQVLKPNPAWTFYEGLGFRGCGATRSHLLMRRERHGPARRRWLERLLRGRPRPDPEWRPPPRRLAPGLWELERRLRLPGGGALTTRSTLARLAGDGLWLHSPVACDGATVAQIRELGEPCAVVAPSSFHYAFAAEACDAFPGAAFFAAPGLADRVGGLPSGPALEDSPPELWRGQIDQAVLGPMGGASEVAFLHRASSTLIVTDLVMNAQRAGGFAERSLHRMNGTWRRLAVPRTVRWMLLRDRDRVDAFAARLLSWEFRRIVMAHGDVLDPAGPADLEPALRAARPV